MITLKSYTKNGHFNSRVDDPIIYEYNDEIYDLKPFIRHFIIKSTQNNIPMKHWVAKITIDHSTRNQIHQNNRHYESLVLKERMNYAEQIISAASKPFNFEKSQHIRKKLYFIDQFYPTHIKESTLDRAEIYEEVHDDLAQVLSDPSVGMLTNMAYFNRYSIEELTECFGRFLRKDAILTEVISERFRSLMKTFLDHPCCERLQENISKDPENIIPGVLIAFSATLHELIIPQKHIFQYLD